MFFGNSDKKNKIIFTGILILSLFVFIRTAWISDDAKITLRYVMNVLHGYGPVFNVGERVQGYTHPLWFGILLVGSFLTKNIFIATFVLSIFTSLLVVWLFLRLIPKTEPRKYFFVLCLILSKAFVDFSTSGLENPLSHLMILVGFWLGFRFLEKKNVKDAFGSLIVLISAYLSRPDLILIVLPFCFFIYLKIQSPKKWKYLMFAMLPVFLWTVFSVIYYGFPFPSTAYAKLGSGVSKIEFIQQGFVYFLDSLQNDPISLLLIFIATLFGFTQRKEHKTLAIGISLYCAYVVWIGGDFMSGRFFSAPLVLSIFLLIKLEWSSFFVKLVPVVLILGAYSSRQIILGIPIQTAIEPYVPLSGIADERAYYFRSTLFSENVLDQPDWSIKTPGVYPACGLVGSKGLEFGPSGHIVDVCGLVDVFFAHIPAKHEKWRIGHFFRQIPTNYMQFISSGNEQFFLDSTLLDLWKKIRMITAGPIFSLARFEMIGRFNFGEFSKYDFSEYQDGHVPSIMLKYGVFKSREPFETGDEKNNAVSYIFSALFQLDKPEEISSLDISISGESEVAVMYEQNGKYIQFLNLTPKNKEMTRYKIKLKKLTPPTQYIHLIPFMNRTNHYIGHLRVNALE